MLAPKSALANDTLGSHIPIVALASLAALPLDHDRVGDETVEGNGDQDGLPHDPPEDGIAAARRDRARAARATLDSARSTRKRVVRRRRDDDPGRRIAGTGGAGHHSGRRQYARLSAGLFACEGLGDLAVERFGQPIGHGVWLDTAQPWAGSRPIRYEGAHHWWVLPSNSSLFAASGTRRFGSRRVDLRRDRHRQVALGTGNPLVRRRGRHVYLTKIFIYAVGGPPGTRWRSGRLVRPHRRGRDLRRHERAHAGRG